MKAARFGFSILLLFAYHKLYGGEPGGVITDSGTGQILYDKARAFQKAAQYDSAIVLFDSARTIFTQANEKAQQWRCIIESAICRRQNGNYDKALDVLSASHEVEQRLQQSEPLIAASRFVAIGSIYMRKGKQDTALTFAYRAFSIQHSSARADDNLLWDIYSLLADVYFHLGEHDSSLAYNRSALQLFVNTYKEGKNRIKVSNSYNSIALIYDARGDYRKGLEYYMKSLEIHRDVLGEEHPELGILYNNLASIYMRLGDYDLSLEHYLKSLSILNRSVESDHPSFGIRYNNIAMTYRSKGEFDKALEFGNKSKAIFEKKLGARHVNVGIAVNNIGRTYSDMKQYERSLQAYKQALDIWEEKLGEKHPNVAQAYFNVGEAYGNLGHFENAVAWLEKSLRVRRETLGEKNVKVAQSFSALGKVYAGRGKTDSALYCYQHAIISLVEDFIDTNVSINPPTLKSSSDLDLLTALSGKAGAFRKRFEITQAVSDLKASLGTYEHAAKLVEKIRRELTVEGSKLLFGQMAFKVYEEGMKTALKLFDLTKKPDYTSTAFSFAERSKAGVLQDAITESNAKQFAGIPDSMLEEETKLRIDLVYHETQLQKEKEKREKANKEKAAEWENRVFDLRRKYENLIGVFEKNYPEYYLLKHQSTAATLADVQNNLPDNNSVLLEYVAGDSAVTIFAVTKTGCTVKSVMIRSSLAAVVQQFRRSIQNLESDLYYKLAGSLYEQLIAPVKPSLKGIQKLYIVPDGILHYLPFEALLTKPTKGAAGKDYSALPYLIKDFEICYQVSARFLGEHTTLSTLDKSSVSFLGIAPVFADGHSHSKTLYNAFVEPVMRSRIIDGERFAELKESENETRSIFNLFESHQQPAKIFLHHDAKESMVKSSEIETYRFLHIATHGIINEEKPELSGIIFAAPEKNSSDDGILYSGEIYNLRLNADLVVLSACETGLGKIAKGEGMLGMTRGFIYAGAKNLLVSLWQVADKSTSDLMIDFYRNILKTQPYSTALRNAKLAMIKGGKYSHPVEWSPFVLTGK